ncbi:Rad53p [Rhizophagus irregularis DAOM 197198w]|uniref:Rad53p n=2 Tax=Rhizophagus irregularis TaxID=588596 RepID=A0A015JS86_RHIIW|nr:Rad53p [Rhizophagus irregularis DAOM 197198w]
MSNKLFKNNFTNWTSGNEKIDNFIQEMQLKINNHNDIIIEWIPYNQFKNIKEIGEVDSSKIYSAIWKDGPLNYDFDKMELKRISSKNVSLKWLQITNSDEFLIKVKACLSIVNCKIYGISQNPDTKNYIIVFQNGYCLKCGKGNFTMTVFSAIWKNGPLNYYCSKMELKRMFNKNVSLKFLQNINVNEFLTKVKMYLKNTDSNYKMYGISQHPDTKDFIIVLQDKYYIEYSKNYCKNCNEVYTNIKYKWCKPCQTNNLKLNFGENKIINDLILEMQSEINNPFDIVFEWIPCNQFNDIEEVGKDVLEIVYSAIWKDGPLYYNGKKWLRKSNTKVALKCLYNSQNNINEFLNKVRTHSTNVYNCNNIQIHGISQNPNTNDYIIILQSKYCEEYSKKCCIKCMEKYTNIMYKWCKSCQIDFLEKNFKTWTSGNKKINDFIQKMQLKTDNLWDIIFEWIPYNQFNKVKKIGRGNIATIYSAIWKNGPLYYNYNKNELTRRSNRKIALKCLYNSQNNIDELLNKINTFLSNKDNNNFKTYGISQNPDTGNYVIVLQDKYYKEYGKSYCKQCTEKYTNVDNKWCKPCQINSLKNNFTYWTSKNRKIDDFIQEMQLKINNWDDIIFEWIPYDQFNDIKEIGKSTIYSAVYSAIWNDGPLYYDNNKMELKRVSKRNIILKSLHYNICNLQNTINKFLNKVNTYTGNSKIYGISQNPDTNDYIIIFQETYCAEYDWTNGNKQINDFIQELQLRINNWNDTVFEWIPYSKFSNIKEIGKSGYSSIYSAIWKDGPLYYDHKNSKEWIRKSDKKVVLKCLMTSEFLNVVKAYLADKDRIILKVYGISQNPDTKDYVIVLHNSKMIEIYERYVKKSITNWFYNLLIDEKIIDFIQQMQLKINYYYDIIFEWIPYNQFDDIEEIGKGGFATVYSAIWEDGPLYFDDNKKEWTREMNKKVALKCLRSSRNINERFLNEAKEYSIDSLNILRIYGISQNPDTKNYIMILQYAEGGDFNKWINGNYENFDWTNKIKVLNNIINGLKEIHQKKKVHHDFHTGNILFLFSSISDISDYTRISDMGLCGEVDNIDEEKIYGVMPYVAPEVLRGKLYTQAADIYSFGMVMYFIATERQPFANRAHDEFLALDICEGVRPEINKLKAPKFYIELMNKCWDLNPNKRPNATEISDQISLWKNDDFEHVENYRKANLFKRDQLINHPQAIYTSRILNPYTKNLSKYYNSNCSECAIVD